LAIGERLWSRITFASRTAMAYAALRLLRPSLRLCNRHLRGYLVRGVGFVLMANSQWLKLSAIGHQPSAIGYWLLAISYWLLAIGYWLLAISNFFLPKAVNLLPSQLFITNLSSTMKEEPQSLNQMPCATPLSVVRVCDDWMACKLMCLGLTPGAEVEIIRRQPLSGRLYLRVLDHQIALRPEEASQVLVQNLWPAKLIEKTSNKAIVHGTTA
jgi:Fe2+ transport system protein FeoA